MTKRNTREKTPEAVGLELLAASQFPTREAVRAFVAGDDFETLGMMVCEALQPDILEEHNPDEVRAALTGGFFLAQDLFRIAQLAAQADAAPFVPPVSDDGWYFTNKAEWLANVQAVAVSSSMVPRGVAAVVARLRRKMGEMLAETVRAGNPQLSRDTTIGLRELGISRDKSSRWQQMASVPEDDFERAVGQHRKRDGWLRSLRGAA